VLVGLSAVASIVATASAFDFGLLFIAETFD
jgi:hypothetical protein